MLQFLAKKYIRLNCFLDKTADWVPHKLSDLAGLPLIIILPGQINEFDLTDYPRFSTVDSRLILNNYFTRSDLEREFLLATSYSKVNQTGRSPPDGAGERTSDEIDAAHALQGMKRKGDEHSGDVTPDKRIKMETDDDAIDPNSYQPTKIILSTEAFSLFQGKLISDFNSKRWPKPGAPNWCGFDLNLIVPER